MLILLDMLEVRANILHFELFFFFFNGLFLSKQIYMQ